MNAKKIKGAAAKHAPSNEQTILIALSQFGAEKQRLFGPRTPSDFETLTRWVDWGWSNEKIFARMESELWRSELDGHGCCAVCSQAPGVVSCEACGMPVEVQS